MIVERLIILVALVGTVALAVLTVRWWNARRVQRLVGLDRPDTLWDSLGQTPDGRRTLIAFSSPSCAACHAAQAPAVRKVEEQLGSEGVRVIRVDAARQPDIARAFGVLTVPSTVVLAPAGQVVAINQGFAPTGRLVEQLQRA